jgi:16S rRNA G966 N2-methylase RsmD
MKSSASGQLFLRYPDLEPELPESVAENPAPIVRVVQGGPVQDAPTVRARQTLRLQTLRHMPFEPTTLPEAVAVKRSDPIYNAHAYLTKVPVSAIEPFIEAFTDPGDVVLDMYGGSGMTGVAAAMHGRRGEVRDISALGQHIGSNYVNLVDEHAFRVAAAKMVDAAVERLGDVYATRCQACGDAGTLSRTVWSYVYECAHCQGSINYYESFKASGWKKKSMHCPSCDELFATRGSPRIGEEPVLDTLACSCSKRLRDQDHTEPLHPVSLEGLSYPDVPIGEERQMFQASALRKHGLLSTASFFSTRNLAVLAALREALDTVEDESIRNKLLFAFTAVLARASKRYQWNPKRPLNAANQNYYIAPVFYEWNVYDLFGRKVDAVLRSDAYTRSRMEDLDVAKHGAVNYATGSADAIDLRDESVHYVFTDPPFGSNIFYSDMNLFQEAWLGNFTDHENEAVVDRSGNGETRRTAERYERLMTNSLREANRVLKPGGWLSLVFSNSSGEMWALVQRAIQAAGFLLEHVAILDKGQRSVKGLASGFENVVTVDLILSMRKAEPGERAEVEAAPDGALHIAVGNVLAEEASPTPSHVYLGVIRDYLSRHWDVSDLDIAGIGIVLQERGYEVDSASGRLRKSEGLSIAS